MAHGHPAPRLGGDGERASTALILWYRVTMLRLAPSGRTDVLTQPAESDFQDHVAGPTQASPINGDELIGDDRAIVGSAGAIGAKRCRQE